MKVYLHYEEPTEDDLKMTVKLTLPKTWKDGPFRQLQEVLIENYNKKFPDINLEFSKFHLESKSGVIFPIDGIVSEFSENADDIYLKSGAPQTKVELGLEQPPAPVEPERPKPRVLPLTESEINSQKNLEAESKLRSENDGNETGGELLICKNFGCQKKFKESQNHKTACTHHSQPPIFHETRKYWACCPDKIAWDWESFMAIPGCKQDRHNNTREGKSVLGGTDVRNKAQEEDDSVPKRLNAPKKPATGLDKLTTLRKALVSAGLKGSLFDEARDQLKEEVAASGALDGTQIWDKVHERLIKRLEKSLEK